jgi:hypothetical protein
MVRQGECLSKIADRYGFFWDALWNHERNAELKEKRKNPNVLMAGDQVFIPEKRIKEESGSTGQVHTFRLKGVPVRLKLRLDNSRGEARAGVPYALDVDGKKFTGTTGADGLVSVVVPPQSAKAHLRLQTGEEWMLDLGYMNPTDYTSGVQARLKNLGYYTGELNGQLDDALREALRDYQGNAGLSVTGEPDDATRAALLSEHGS